MRKILVIGLVILFFGASILTGVSGKNISDNKSITTTDTQIQPLFEGNSYFILLSDYTDGAGQENKWAVVLKFDSDTQ